MTIELQKLLVEMRSNEKFTNKQLQRATILQATNIQTKTLTIHCTKYGNISVKETQSEITPVLYSVPGKSIIFSVNHQPLVVQLYTIENERLNIGQRVTVTDGSPLLIDGRQTLFDCNPRDQRGPTLYGSINLPERSTDISVYERSSLRQIGWFPHDDSAARYLASLEMLEAAEDPGAARVAEELIFHYHPAVAWQAFRVMHAHMPQTALQYLPLLHKLQDSRLDRLLEQFGEAA